MTFLEHSFKNKSTVCIKENPALLHGMENAEYSVANKLPEHGYDPLCVLLYSYAPSDGVDESPCASF